MNEITSTTVETTAVAAEASSNAISTLLSSKTGRYTAVAVGIPSLVMPSTKAARRSVLYWPHAKQLRQLLKLSLSWLKLLRLIKP